MGVTPVTVPIERAAVAVLGAVWGAEGLAVAGRQEWWPGS